MGISFYLEDQVHVRTYAGPEASAQLSKVLVAATPEGLLSGIHAHGDTMFNIVQLKRIEKELDAIVDGNPELWSEVSALKQIFEKVARVRGYLWRSGD